MLPEFMQRLHLEGHRHQTPSWWYYTQCRCVLVEQVEAKHLWCSPYWELEVGWIHSAKGLVDVEGWWFSLLLECPRKDNLWLTCREQFQNWNKKGCRFSWILLLWNNRKYSSKMRWSSLAQCLGLFYIDAGYFSTLQLSKFFWNSNPKLSCVIFVDNTNITSDMLYRIDYIYIYI